MLDVALGMVLGAIGGVLLYRLVRPPAGSSEPRQHHRYKVSLRADSRQEMLALLHQAVDDFERKMRRAS